MKRKQAVAVIMTVVLSFSLLSGCGKRNEASVEQPSEEQAVQETAVNENVAGDSQETVFDENGISGPGQLPFSKETKTISVFIPQLSSVADITQHTVMLELQEKANIKLDMTVVPQDGAAEKLNLMMASGDYPDVIIGYNIFSNQDLIRYGTEEQILIPLNNLIDKYCVNIQDRWAEHPDWKEQMTMPDGNIYGIPDTEGAQESHGSCGMKYWINREWLDTLGLEMPTTTKELKEVLQAFKDKDPNGNGIADEIPLTGATKTWNADPYLFLLNAFGYFDTNYYYLKDGKINSILDQDYLREGLAYVADLYKSGLIDPAAFTQDESQLAAIGNNEGVAIAGSATCGHVGMFVNINDAERYKQYEIMMPLEGSNGYRGIPYGMYSTVQGATFAITEACECPEIAIKLADLFCGEEWSVRAGVGIQGEQWDYADEGAVGLDGVTPAKYKFLKLQTQTAMSQDNITWDHSFSVMGPNIKPYIQMEGDILDPVNYEGRLWADTKKVKKYAADVDVLPPLFYSSEDSDKLAQISTAVSDYASNVIIEFVTGKLNLDTDWDSHLKKLETLGYAEEISMIQAAYDAR